MKIPFLRSVALITLSLATLSSVAVTKDEMEQARTIAAKTYLRWANDASGYLDGVQAKTLDQLKSQLKPKEIENLKAFIKVPVPSDYASWDKDKLVHFWSVTFFNSPELSDAGKRGKSRVGAQISKLTIAVPAPQETPTPSETKPATSPATAQPGAATAPEAPTADEATAAAEEEAIAAPEPRKRESSNTAVYVAILAVLVAVVVALVVYAVNSMKESGKTQPAPGKGSEPEGKTAATSSIGASVSALESELAAVKTERDAWRRRAEKAEKALAEARETENQMRREAEEQTRRAEAEAMQRLKKRAKEEAHQREEEAAKAAEALRLAEERRAEELRKAEEALKEAEARRAAVIEAQKASPISIKESAQKRPVRTIYLGRVNAHGIFVRADRQPIAGHSFFALTTSDGMSGSFSVIDNPDVYESALADPESNLTNACTGHNLLDTLGATEVTTEQSGTAIFEGGCWRVARKARIAYE